jgi:uncharacterized repeat protein (TIGR03803 family)
VTTRTAHALALVAIAFCSLPPAPAAAQSFTYEQVYRFQTAAREPLGPLVSGPDGALYGVARESGRGYGSVFRVDIADGTVTTLHIFEGADGASPSPQALLVGRDGAFYGTTFYGGLSFDGVSDGYGAVVRMDASGEVTLAYSFDGCAAGCFPHAGLVQGEDGALYGMTTAGGEFGYGTVFRLDAAGTLTTLHAFTGADGWPNADPADPAATLVVGRDGAFYGTARDGGPELLDRRVGNGTAFRVDTAGMFTVLHTFTARDAHPGALLQARDGDLYGTAGGTVFRLTTTGAFATLASDFSLGLGSFAPISLLQANDGSFYGTTGTSDCGCSYAFRLDPAGQITPLHWFSSAAGDGSVSPGLVERGDGLYGSTSDGGPLAGGTIFRIDPAGAFTQVAVIAVSDGGVAPYGGLTQAADGAIYGTTLYGGANDLGTVFRLDGLGNLATVAALAAPNARPIASLVQGSDGTLYGTSFGIPGQLGGSVYRLDRAETLTTVHEFGGAPDGSCPHAPVLIGAGGVLYGTTMCGGDNAWGTVFAIDASASYRTLYSFSLETGGVPSGGLVQDADGYLYGTTQIGGESFGGTIFRLHPSDPSATFHVLHSFARVDGAAPNAALVKGPDGAFYGTTMNGGSFSVGTVFRIDAHGAFETLHHFIADEGGFPMAVLAVGRDGWLYGTASGGEVRSAGTLFRITPSGEFETLHRFRDSGSFQPIASLLLARDGSWYGTAPGRGGVIFRLKPLRVGNHAPMLTAPGNQRNRDVDSVSLAIGASDPDGDALAFMALGLPPGLVIDGTTGRIHGTCERGTAGDFEVTIEVSDGIDTVQASFTWTVVPNSAPIVPTPPHQTNREGDVVALSLAASDPDGDPLTFTAIGLPPDLAIGADGRIAGTLSHAAIGEHTVTVRVSDGFASTTVTFGWTVDPLPPAVINVAETITVSDVVKVLPAAMIAIAETVAVADAVAIIPAALISISEAIVVADDVAATILDTLSGTDISVRLVDSTTTASFAITFAAVSAAGVTTVDVLSDAPSAPAGFQAGAPAVVWDLSTTAAYAAPVTVCVNVGAIAFDNPAAARLFHYEATAWVDRTISVDIASRVICGSVSSLSPFAIFEPVVPALTGRMSGEGAIAGGGARHRFEFEVAELLSGSERGRLRYSVAHGTAERDRATGRFEATTIAAVKFWDDAAIPRRHKAPAADSVVFSGHGTWNGADGYSFEVRATDTGEPGRGRDTFAITIRDANGVVVSTAAGTLIEGNIEAEGHQR